MSRWSIRKHLILLSMLPALLASVSLTVYFTYTQLNEISNSLRANAEGTIDHLSELAEYPVFSGNTDELQRIGNRIMQNRSIISIKIKDNNKRTMLYLRSQSDEEYVNASTGLYDNRLIELSRDILATDTPLDGFDNGGEGLRNAMKLGSVELVVTNRFNNQRKAQILVRSLIITFSILLLSALIGLTVSRRIADPVQKLTEIVGAISAGRLDVRARLSAPAELGILESRINHMADELQIAHTDIEERIDEFTEEFQQTLEELEIRNAQLDIARSNAQQANNAKSEFLASMSHEIRTPLSGIMGFSELLEQSELPPKEKEYATIIRNSSRNLLGIIEEILDISKIESGKVEIVEGECDINEVLDNVISLLSPAAVDKEIELFYTVADNVPALIITDALRLQQIFTNLIGNAIKFTSDGYVRINVYRDNDSLRCTIIDTGIGLDSKAKDRLFNAFTQADDTITQQFGGTGLGLVISRKLTQLLNGDIGFDSTFGEGTEFWFTLPVKLPEYDLHSPVKHLAGTHLCMIAEHHATRDALAARLRRWGAEISNADADGQCMDTLSTDTMDAIIVSISHTEDPARYIRILEKIDQSGIDLPVLAVTSSNKQSLYDELLAAGTSVCTPRSTSNFKLLELLCQITGIPSLPDHSQTEDENQPPDLAAMGVRALIVDDNMTNLKLASIILGKTGMDITTADSGMKAIELATDNGYDVIFLDIQMPGMDGFETLKHLREGKHQNTHIIALTAHMMPKEKQRALESGFDKILIKPLSEHIVYRVLTDWEAGTGTRKHTTDSSRLFDADEAMTLAGESSKLVIEMTSMFLSQLGKHRGEIRDALARQDTVELKHVIHTLHGATRYVAFPALRTALKEFERAIDREETDSFQAMAETVFHEIREIQAIDLQKIMANLE